MSLTADLVAFVRAREQALPPERRVVDDPFADRFLRLAGARVARPYGVYAGALGLFFKLPVVGFDAVVLARHRVMDDLLLEETAAGARQCVILGAGWDARAYRFPPPRGPERFFEVDQPAMSARKRDLAARVLDEGSAPAHVRHVAVDFMRERLDERLAAEGFDPGARTVFIWEGVTYYLTDEAVRGTLRTVRALGAPGSTIVFDAWARGRGLRGALLEAPRAGARLAARAIGEPFLFDFPGPEAAGDRLREAGYHVIFVRQAQDLAAVLRRSGRRWLRLPPQIVVAAGRIP